MKHCTPVTFPEDETFDVGIDTRTGVSMLEYRYDSPFPFTGKIDKLNFQLKPFPPEKTDKPMTEEENKRIKSIADTVTTTVSN